MSEDRSLARIAALLRKAEGTDNEHEADAYLQAAQRLATLESVDLAVARAHTAQQEQRQAPTQRSVDIGQAGRKGLKTYVQLFVAIGRANNLTCDVAHNSTRVFAYGYESDLNAVEALYASLVVQMVRASDLYIKSKDHLRDTVTSHEEVPGTRRFDPRKGWVADFRPVQKPVHATTARLNFQDAFAIRIGRRLAEAKEQAQAQAVATDTAAGTAGVGVALALRNREVELADHYRSTSRARGSWSGPRSARADGARRAGDSAGRTAKLGGDTAIGGSRAAIGGAG